LELTEVNFTRYICEIAPSARRGMLVSMPQFMASLGICCGYFTCYGSVHIDSPMSWRLPFLLMAATAVILAVACFFLPQSPRWLLLHDRRDEALRELERLDISSVEAEKDIIRPAELSRSTIPTRKTYLSIFNRQYRLRTMLGLFVLGMVQLSGIDGVLYVCSGVSSLPL